MQRRDYHEAYAAFSLAEAAKELSGDLGRGINVCVEACDRHAGSNATALYWADERDRSATVTFRELRERAGRFANVLANLGIKRGDRVAGLLPRIPDLLTVILGTWRIGAVYQPLFTAFGSKAIEHRVQTSGAKLVVTDAANRGKLDGISALPPIATIADSVAPGDIDFRREMERASPDFAPVMLTGDDPFLMMFTSGTTGLPKGLFVPIRAVLSFITYLRLSVGLEPEDSYWNMADPGWAYGLFIGITAPLVLGHPTIFYDGPFSVDAAYRVIEKYNVSVIVSAPTAYRMMMAAGPAAAKRIKGKLRAVTSGGEPLNPEVIRWFREHLDVAVGDHYGQTEGAMMVCNHHGLAHPVKIGAAGLTMPGIRMAILDDKDRELPRGKPGILAVDRARSPLFWFTGYYRQAPASGAYHRTGDAAVMDEEGYVTFVGRADDVITSAGYRIGPYEVESALIEHPAVAESGVIGKPDPERTEIVKAFVVLRPGHSPSNALATELSQFVKTRLSAHSFPREIEFVSELPKTPSGKVQRYVLRERETGARGASA